MASSRESTYLTAVKPISSAAIVRKDFRVGLGDGSRLSPPFLVLRLPSTLHDARLREPSRTIFRGPDDTAGALPVGTAAESRSVREAGHHGWTTKGTEVRPPAWTTTSNFEGASAGRIAFTW